MISLSPNFKSESWKFTPKKTFSNLSFKSIKESSLENLLSLRVGVGSQLNQLNINTLQDLQDEGYVKITEERLRTIKDQDSVDKAKLDETVFSIWSSEAKTLKISISSKLPAALWIPINKVKQAITISIEPNSSQDLYLFEEDSAETDIYPGLLDIEVNKSATLNLGINFCNSMKNYYQIRSFSEQNSVFNCYSLISGKEDNYKRLEIISFLIGESASACLNGLSVLNSNSISDYHSDIFHLNKNQTSTQKINTLNNESSHSIFGGRIHLSKNSSGAEVNQLNKNLILDKKAKVDTQPELNIYNDDVKASHGATTGKIDPEHFFYLVSRGFSKEQAKDLLLKAFTEDTLTNFSSHFKNYFSTLIEQGI